MSKRITIIQSDDVHKKLRQLQAKLIAQTDQSVSFSRVIEEVLVKGLRK